MTDSEQRMFEALQDADDAFWDSVRQSYPEATSGGLAVSFVVDTAILNTRALQSWVDENVPRPILPLDKKHIKARRSRRKQVTKLEDALVQSEFKLKFIALSTPARGRTYGAKDFDKFRSGER